MAERPRSDNPAKIPSELPAESQGDRFGRDLRRYREGGVMAPHEERPRSGAAIWVVPRERIIAPAPELGRGLS